MRARETGRARPAELFDRKLWRRSQETETVPDEVERLLDLAAYAENRLDAEDAARVAELLARDADAASDVAAARALAGVAMLPADAEIVARAESLVLGGPPEALLIAFPTRAIVARPWYRAASWSSLAAAMLLAGWLGFSLGSGLSDGMMFSRPADDASANELLDPAPLLLRDFTESSRI